MHESPKDTRERSYERLRKEGWTKAQAERDAEKTARIHHENLNKNGVK